MNIYRVNQSYDVDDPDGIAWEHEYLTHNDKFTKIQFENVCKEAMTKSKKESNEVTLYSVIQILERDYGFKKLYIEYSFDFHEEY